MMNEILCATRAWYTQRNGLCSIHGRAQSWRYDKNKDNSDEIAMSLMSSQPTTSWSFRDNSFGQGSVTTNYVPKVAGVNHFKVELALISSRKTIRSTFICYAEAQYKVYDAGLGSPGPLNQSSQAVIYHISFREFVSTRLSHFSSRPRPSTNITGP